MVRRRLGAALAAVAVLLCTAGCQVTLSAGVDVRADGSGVVRAALGLDDGALRELGNPETQLRLDDLRQSGWTVSGPATESDGLTWVRLAKRFADAGEAGRVAAELSGPDGPFREFQVTRSRTFAKTTTRFTGLVDLSGGLAGLSDPGLEQAVGDALAALQQRIGGNLDEAVRVRVDAQLPGRSQTWVPTFGAETRLELESEAWNVRPVAAAAASLLFALMALVTVVVRRRR